ncbi:hypothetical protein GCM10008967_21190 [Bacillus carboniphilus]|uniref:Exonuclease domain-containing protein n=1 Tax=Bacillus carboniphilus TaxID=86663 RepID=A0ABP3G0A6_9BACI
MATIQQYIFFDFEMFCSLEGTPFSEMEAIRLGAVKYDIATKEISYFDQYIKPKNRNPLSSFCKELTGIMDEDLLFAPNFKQVFKEFLFWIGGVKRTRFFSWSTSDLLRLKLDAECHDIPLTTIQKIEKRYIDFQGIFAKRVSKSTLSVEHALEKYGLSFVGDKHNPMWDSYNTLQIYLNFLDKPLATDLIMVNQYIRDEVPIVNSQLNQMITKEIKKDTSFYLEEFRDTLRMRDAQKLLKKTRKLNEKYENILLNRSGIFSEENILYSRLIVGFYHELLSAYEEHKAHSSKIMILDEHSVRPLYQFANVAQ